MYRYIEPEYLWTCPEDGKKFNNPQDKCRYCDHFVRFHTDNISGLDIVIGCKFPEDSNQTVLKEGDAKDE